MNTATRRQRTANKILDEVKILRRINFMKKKKQVSISAHSYEYIIHKNTRFFSYSISSSNINKTN